MSSNGELTLAELAPAAGGIGGPDPGQGQLATDTARRWNAMWVEITAKEGTHAGCNGADSMYRPISRQWYYYNAYLAGWGNLAAYPGTSNHGWGKAIDNAFRALIDRYGAKYGFRWACSDAPSESWHLLDCGPSGAYPGPDPGPGGNLYPTIKQGAHGDAVVRLQDRLAVHNKGIAQAPKNGQFDQDTLEAVKQFQRCRNLADDGEVGPATWHKLNLREPLMDAECSNVNRLRLLEAQGSPTDKDKEKMQGHRDWLARRAKWMVKTWGEDHSKWNNQRRVRYTIVKREAGNA